MYVDVYLAEGHQAIFVLGISPTTIFEVETAIGDIYDSRSFSQVYVT